MNKKSDRLLFPNHEYTSKQQKCPRCDGMLVLRYGKSGPFLGCEHYPKCDYIQPLHHNDGHIVKALGVPCPLCTHELVLRQGRYGMFIGCSDYPQCQYFTSPEQNGQNDTSKTASIACPECRKGHLVERVSRYGKAFYACDAFPKCKFAINHQPVLGKCSECGYPLLMAKKTAAGVVYRCAARKCHYTFSDIDTHPTAK